MMSKVTALLRRSATAKTFITESAPVSPWAYSRLGTSPHCPQQVEETRRRADRGR
jgi:hypothetical protein